MTANGAARRGRNALVRILQGAVSIGLMSLIWWRLDDAEAWHRLSGAAPGWLLAALAALLVQTALSAQRWRITARIYGIEIGTGHALREYLLAQAVNQSLPGGVVGDVGRAIRSRGPSGLWNAGQSVLFERLWGQIALFCVMLAAVAWTALVPGGIELPRWLLAFAGTVAGAVLAAVPILAIALRLPGRAGSSARRLVHGLRRGLWTPRIRATQAGLSLGTVAANLLAFAFCARATGTALPATAIVTLVPVILLMMVVPISISGWGLRESAAALVFPVIGASAEAGLAASIAFGLVFLASALPGLLVLLLPLRRRSVPPRDPIRFAPEHAAPGPDPPAKAE